MDHVNLDGLIAVIMDTTGKEHLGQLALVRGLKIQDTGEVDYILSVANGSADPATHGRESSETIHFLGRKIEGHHPGSSNKVLIFYDDINSHYPHRGDCYAAFMQVNVELRGKKGIDAQTEFLNQYRSLKKEDPVLP